MQSLPRSVIAKRNDEAIPSPKRHCEEVRRSNLKGHAQNIRLFKPLILSNNGIKFNPEGSGLKTWMACKNFIILQSEFIM